MIVDKKLRGVKAVQTLSRLNRICPGKEDTFILDFANKGEDIIKAFQPFYQATILEGEVNTDLVYRTQQEIRSYALYSDEEVEHFADIWSKSGRQGSRDLGKLYSILQPVCDRYNQLEEDGRYQYRRKLRSFTRWYQYLTQIVRMFDVPTQKEYYFLKFLLTLLPKDSVEKIDLQGKLTLEYYKNTETFHGALSLVKENGTFTPSSGGGAAGPQPKTPLDEIIASINERYKGDFTPADRVMLDNLYHRLKENTKLAISARTSDPANFANTTFANVFGEEMVKCYNEQKECYESAFKSEEKYNAIMSALSSFLYNEFRKSIEEPTYASGGKR